jgi:hypothetical protein
MQVHFTILAPRLFVFNSNGSKVICDSAHAGFSRGSPDDWGGLPSNTDLYSPVCQMSALGQSRPNEAIELESAFTSIVLQNDFEPRSEENFFQIKAE